MIIRILGLLLLALSMELKPAAQEADERSTTYILVDASGTMKELEDEASSKIEAALQLLDAGHKVSVTFFGAKRADRDEPVSCDDEVAIAEPKLPDVRAPDFPTFGGKEDSTSIGKALKDALNYGGDKAKVILITDGIEECNSDFSSIRRRFPEATIDVVQVGDRPNTALNLLELQPQQKVVLQTAPGPLPIQIVAEEGNSSDSLWEDSGPLERWFWLVIFGLSVFSAWAFTKPTILKAHAYEERSKEIQERQRALLTGQGDREENERQIAMISDFDEPKHLIWVIVGWIATAFVVVFSLTLLFVEENFFWFGPLGENDRFLFIELETARKLSWMVLSSGFSNAFAIIGITPILYWSAQNWRFFQSKRTFLYVTGEAAEEEARKRKQEVAELFAELVALRESISNSKVSSRWADPPKKSRWRDIPDKYDEVDRQFLSIVKERLRTYAQGPEPVNAGQSPKKLRDQIAEVSIYAPKSRLRRLWLVPALIRSLSNRNWLSHYSEDWLKLAEHIDQRDTRKIKVSLKLLASYDMSPEAQENP